MNQIVPSHQFSISLVAKCKLGIIVYKNGGEILDAIEFFLGPDPMLLREVIVKPKKAKDEGI